MCEMDGELTFGFLEAIDSMSFSTLVGKYREVSPYKAPPYYTCPHPRSKPAYVKRGVALWSRRVTKVLLLAGFDDASC